MSAAARLAEFIDSVTYKPGWSLAVCDHGFDLTLCLDVMFMVPDSDPPHDVKRLCHHRPIPPYITEASEDAIMRWLRFALHAVEAHEADEWLRRDGVAPFHPHRAGGR